MTRRLRIVLFALVLSIHVASAQPLPEGMTMHRQGAGELDASGWTTAASTLGGFSVRLPLTFNDFTVAAPPSKGQVAKTFVVGAKSVEGVKFTAARMVYRKNDAAQSFFARIESGEAFAGNAAPGKSHRVQGRKAVDVSISSDRALGYFRYVLMDDSLISLVVEVPAARGDLIPSTMVQAFFDSLRVSRP